MHYFGGYIKCCNIKCSLNYACPSSHLQIPEILVPWHSLWDYFLRPFFTVPYLSLSGNITENLWWKFPTSYEWFLSNIQTMHLMSWTKVFQQVQKFGFCSPPHVHKKQVRGSLFKSKYCPSDIFSLNLRYLLPLTSQQTRKYWINYVLLI